MGNLLSSAAAVGKGDGESCSLAPPCPPAPAPARGGGGNEPDERYPEWLLARSADHGAPTAARPDRAAGPIVASVTRYTSARDGSVDRDARVSL